MPIIIRRGLQSKVNHRRQQFNAAVRQLAPIIAEIRKKGHVSVGDIMQRLNDQGIAAPGGKLFSFGATHRLLKRLEQLRLGPGPRSVSAALSARPYKDRSLSKSSTLAW